MTDSGFDGRSADTPRQRLHLEALEARDVPSTVYVSDTDGDLFTVDPESGTTSHLGRMRVAMADLAVDPSGGVWGVDTSANRRGFGRGDPQALYRIDPETAKVRRVGLTNLPVEALAFNNDGELYGAWGTTIYLIDQMSGRATSVYSFSDLVGDGNTRVGDLAFDALGSLYLTTVHEQAPTNQILKFGDGFSSGVVLASNLPVQLEGLAIDGGVLYAFGEEVPTGAEKVYSIDMSTGATTEIATIASADLQFIIGAASSPPV